jgi:CPA2 family monovalent cation:H+ antiporter-2
MTESSLLQDVVVILGISVITILLFQRLKLPSILGLLLTGIIAGPHGFGFVKASHGVELLSEIGIVFLLFIIGIEFSLKSLASIKRTVFLGGFLQVGLTIATTTLLVLSFGLSLPESVFIGFLVSLSSTAIVLKLLQEKGLIMSPHGRVSVALLIFQDLIVVPMMLAIPLLAGHLNNIWNTLLILSVKMLVVGLVIFLLSRYIMPYILKRVVQTKNKELFILTIVVACFATAWLTASFGLSVALGAFFAGLIISESDYSHHATANILPFREIFISFFFVSVGMLLDTTFFVGHIALILALTVVASVLKIAVTSISVAVVRYQQRTVYNSALNLFQIGEFSFLLAGIGISYQLLSHEVYQYFLSVSVLSMAATPFVMNFAPRIVDSMLKIPIPSRVRHRLNTISQIRHKKPRGVEEFNDHIVIIGYGLNGRNVARAAKYAGISYVIIEIDPTIVEDLKIGNEPVVFGDGSSDVILNHVNISKARVVVIAISDPDITRTIVSTIRHFSELSHIIVRTKYTNEIDENLKIGADEVIPEEFETSIEIFTSVLRKYLVPRSDIAEFVECIRSKNYELFCEKRTSDNNEIYPLSIPEMDIVTLKVLSDYSEVIGKTIEDLAVRPEFGITILAIRRETRYLTNLLPDQKIEPDDVLYVFGKHSNIIKFHQFMRKGRKWR